MPSGVEPIEGTEQAKVWVQMDLTVSLAEYEPLKLTLGTSRTCRNSATTTTRIRKELTWAIEGEIAEALERFTQLAEDRGLATGRSRRRRS